MKNRDFQELVWDFAKTGTRTMPWRENTSPYYVLVSEIMLQQTQVDRVVPKFEQFISHFPSTNALAEASLRDVLEVWDGLGYSRRAKFLWQASKQIETDFARKIPSTYDELVQLSGVGPNTAGAVLAYAYNQPVVFVETNIRTVFMYHFFTGRENVTDAQIYNKVQQTLDKEHPRQWYWALMDYGTHLKKQGVRNIHLSKHYKKQSKFEGSVRQVRGQILRVLAKNPMSEKDLKHHINADHRFPQAITGLINEGFVRHLKGMYKLT